MVEQHNVDALLGEQLQGLIARARADNLVVLFEDQAEQFADQSFVIDNQYAWAHSCRGEKSSGRQLHQH